MKEELKQYTPHELLAAFLRQATHRSFSMTEEIASEVNDWVANNIYSPVFDFEKY